MVWDRTELPWLLRPPTNFRTQVKEFDSKEECPESGLRKLASFAMDNNQLSMLAKKLQQARNSSASLHGLDEISIAILANSSQELISNAIQATGLRYGLNIRTTDLPFDSIESIVLNPSSALYSSKPDYIVLSLTAHFFEGNNQSSAFDQPEKSGADKNRFNNILRCLKKNSQAGLILQTIPKPENSLLGDIDLKYPSTALSIISDVNSEIMNHAKSTDTCIDISRMAETIGLDVWHHKPQWHAFKLPFSQKVVPLYADALCRHVSAIRGGSKKCLVLDLDNTLWGGVIGDDGLNGIRIGQGSGEGEAFLDFQKFILALYNRGIVLAVSSKNTEDIARSVFQHHPDMLLKESHIAVFQANWLDKAKNIETIAKELNIGLDSIVFFDDNPAERDLVRQKLPMVAVPEVPSDPALYSRALSAAGYFNVITHSREDAARNEMYAARAEAIRLQDQFSDLFSYHQSLQMRIDFSPFDEVGQSRIAQLINKSNQFNLTTHRYSEDEVKKMRDDPSIITIQVRLQDKFADHGMISVLILKEDQPGRWGINTWLMSCRVLTRRVEEIVLVHLIALVREKGGSALVGHYIPTSKNSLVANHYEKLGFNLLEKNENDETYWELLLNNFEPNKQLLQLFNQH
jgi:FkbH-like protein